MLSFLYQLSSEIGLILLYPVMYISLQFIPSNQLEGKGKGRKIVIVERWLSINLNHLYWKYYLEKKGFKVYLVNFPLWHKDFRESAKTLSGYMQNNNISNATIVGISSGAITGLLYLENHNGWERVNRFITIGAPFKGTWAALFLLVLYSGRELLPGSQLVKYLSTIKIHNQKNIYCFRARFDEMVPYGSVLSGASEIVMNIVGHNNLHIRIRYTYRKIAELAQL
jgi:pimeloyl-ACP methyl ester carboxylesterase